MIYGLLALGSLALLFVCIAIDIVGLCLGQRPWRRP
jgi:hypothetical protein